MTAIQVPGSRRTREDIHRHPLKSLLTITQRQARMLSNKTILQYYLQCKAFLIYLHLKKLLLFSVNDNMSTSGNLKGEKNVDFDNFMMIAYI